MEPETVARRCEKVPVLPSGAGERFSGYGVMGVPFRSGHYLAMRRFTASSIGPGYRAVWHRDPDGAWTIYADVAPEVSCARFFGSALSATPTAAIRIDWVGPHSLRVQVPEVLTWQLEIGAAFGTRVMNAVGAWLPTGACHANWLLRPMGTLARPVLSVGTIRMTGLTPNGQTFGALPRRIWRITQSSAVMGTESFGPPSPLPTQDHLGDFMLPQRGIFFADVAAVFTSADPD